MYSILNTLHSYNRYLLLVAILFLLYRSITGWLGKKPYEKADNAVGAATLGLTHLQLLLGLLLYVTSPRTQAAFADMGAAMKDSILRYFAVEHMVAMLIAVVLIQMGRTLSKKAVDDNSQTPQGGYLYRCCPADYPDFPGAQRSVFGTAATMAG